MEPEIRTLAQKIVSILHTLPPERRLLVAIAGPPGSGKSTLAYPLTDLINSLALGRPVEQRQIDPATGLQESSAANEAGEASSKADEGEVAVCVGLDGWHHSRAELDGFDDPVEAHWRRVS